ncbi:hypothetical protein DOTSEDRAFT_75304 [Dothistroma septosporum NZE10]|uniref:DUF221-domain-containing protein n=1 Tax=Dothistroma septosporum (strain NZE10 / CBS 128990) TaxID=675120 RepID=M2WKV1_DOTSN|nr:hypothetical protein DOTSEDRAFT_75304 [Dothistroma septosporum NZE10]
MNILKEGGNRSSGSTSGRQVLGAFIPALAVAISYTLAFVLVRNQFRKVYAPRTFLGTIPEKDRTPTSRAEQWWWFKDFRKLPDHFVLQHNSLDAFLFLRFLKLLMYVCLGGALLTWPILFAVNATGGGNATQLDRLSIGNVSKTGHLWAHTTVAWFLFLGIFCVIACERLHLIGVRQAYYLNDAYASKLSAKTVLFMNVPNAALQPESLKASFGKDAVRTWPVKDVGDLEELVEQRNGAAYDLESAEMDMIQQAVTKLGKNQQKINGRATNVNEAEEQSLVPMSQRPITRKPPVFGSKVDRITEARNKVLEIADTIEARRAAPGRNVGKEAAVFVTFSTQQAAHIAFQQISFQPRIPLEDRFLAVQPKEVLWKNVQLPVAMRLSKSSLALAFVIVFTIFFSIPVGILGTWSNVAKVANEVRWLDWLNRLPNWLLSLLTGLIPPALTSWFVSYVPKLFRHIAKLSGEPTIPQAELKTQAWNFVFQVFQVFLVTTISSGAASVVQKIAQHPDEAPTLLAENLPTASNFYLTYFILQGLASPASNILDYTETLEYLFYEHYWDKTPREKFQTYAQMRGTPWGAWYPKFTNFFVIAVAYACIQPMIIGFAAIGIFLYYNTYRYSLLYVRQTKTDTKGEAYKRALQQMPTGLYLAELCLIGLMAARGAAVQTALMVTLLVITAVANFVLDRMLKSLELYLGVDKWQAQEVPLLAEEDGVDPNDRAALHAASHGRRLGLNILPSPAPRQLSDFFDSIISAARGKVQAWLDEPVPSDGDSVQLSEADIAKAYIAPAFTSQTPKLWIPRDTLGVSQQEIQHNEAVGISTTDDAAEVDENGRLHWNHNFEDVPIFSKPKVF